MLKGVMIGPASQQVSGKSDANSRIKRRDDFRPSQSFVYCVLGIALPRWQVTHCTRIPFGADVDFPRSASNLELMSFTNLIITRAVFLACLSSEAASIGIWPLAPGCAPAISA